MIERSPPAVPRPVMLQSWHSLTFVHWKYPPAVLRPLLPAELELDLFGGHAWVGLTPFLLGLRFPRLPLRLSRIPEINLRTYVRGPGGRRGIWFFSLDIGFLAAAVAARAGYGLPYFWSSMTLSETQRCVRYQSRRKRVFQREACVQAKIEPGPRIQADELERFLTDRYRLFARRRGRLVSAAVEHQPWPLRRARILELEQTLVRAAGLREPRGEPIVHFSEGVEVRVGGPRPIDQQDPTVRRR